MAPGELKGVKIPLRFTQGTGGTGGTWVMLWINLVQLGGDQRLWEIKKGE